MIEQSQFYHDFTFDVFVAMRDAHIKYGVNHVGSEHAEATQTLWESARAFRSLDPTEFEWDANFSWHVDPANSHDHAPDHFSGPAQLVPKTDFYRKTTTYDPEELSSAFDQRDGDRSPVLRHGLDDTMASTPDLDTVTHHCGLDTKFELGNLRYLRSAEFKAYFDHLDATGLFYYQHFGDAGAHPMVATTLLPRSSIWRVGEMSCTEEGHAFRQPPVDARAEDFASRRRFLATLIGAECFGWTEDDLDDPDNYLPFWHQFWHSLQKQMDATQKKFPKPSLGHSFYGWAEVENSVLTELDYSLAS